MATKLLWTFLLLLPLTAKNDDAFMGSRGGNVFPIIRNEKIRMTKEEIKVKMFTDSCNVNCKFWFTSESDDTIEYVLMGFPDYFANLAQDSKALRNFTFKIT